MLNKDQYNQEEYNNYYKQEVEGAEIKGYSRDEGGFPKKAILLITLIALGVAGYFGFKMINKTDSNTETKEYTAVEEDNSGAIESSSEDELKKDIKREVSTEVQEGLEKNKKMSSEDIAKIVDLVMNKMEKENIEVQKVDKDNDLISALENSNDDKEENINEDETVVHEVSAIETETKEIKTNNKVTVDSKTNSNDTDLNELSEQIKTLLNIAGESSEPTQHTSNSTLSQSTTETPIKYEESITQEIKVRKNEMRIIVVRPGDTLNKIAQRAYGSASSYQKIYDANPEIRRADRIYVGQKLRIPK